MSINEGRDYLYLIWKSEKSRRQYIVGQLSKNGHYEFKYCGQINEAINEGFTPLVSFQKLDEQYVSKELFPVFESRLPDRKRKDMDKILQKYGLKQYDAYQLLKKSGARLPIDKMYFIDPILDADNDNTREFYMAGSRHYIGCEGVNCAMPLSVKVGDMVALVPEPTNVKDPKAVMVTDDNHVCLGYIPRYYSESIFDLISEKRCIECNVIEVNHDMNCDECVTLKIVIK